jgi:hypothetical protein
VLKIKLADLKRELHVLRTGVANVDVLKREVRGWRAAHSRSSIRTGCVQAASRKVALRVWSVGKHFCLNSLSLVLVE